ncbi:MAG TPA: hypothetical protein VMB34_02920 [Acetobacteraceae bacterium]|nr:hypothetical protein [Acetobacteraceae bacterium]
MKKTAGLYMGAEKRGCHEIAIRNSAVIDCEIAFPRPSVSADSPAQENPGRVDIACLEEFGDDIRVVFWKAKHFTNKDLRSDKYTPKVCEQIARYRRYLKGHQAHISKSYTGVVESLFALKDMNWVRALSPLLEDVQAGRRRLILGDTPKVGLVIFGFDAAQRDGKAWSSKHLKKLQSELGAPNIIAVGDPTRLKLPT